MSAPPTATPSPASPPTESRELDLVTKLDFRLALASTPAQLQPLITTYLAPLLLKLGSPHASVRAKTREVCLHVSPRLRNLAEIEIPVPRLLGQFREIAAWRGEMAELGEGVRRFGLVFISLGLNGRGGGGKGNEVSWSLVGELLRLPPDHRHRQGGEREEVEGLERGEEEPFPVRVKEEQMSLDTRLYMQGLYHLLRILPTVTRLPERNSPDDKQLKEQLGLSARETAHLARWLGRFLLADSHAFSPLPVQPSSSESNSLRELPGLTRAERAVLATWATTSSTTTTTTTTTTSTSRREPAKAFEQLLTQTKLAVANFLFSTVFTDADRFLPAVIMGTDDANLGLFRLADTMFKQCTFDLEDAALVDALYTLYFGVRRTNPKSDGAAAVAQQEEDHDHEAVDEVTAETAARAPARPKLQMRILGLLAKSKLAATRTGRILRLLDQQLSEVKGFGLEARKLRTALFGFLNWMLRVGTERDILAIAPKAVEGFRSYILDQGWPDPVEITGKSISAPELEMRGNVYENIGTWTAKMEFTKSYESHSGQEEEEEEESAESELVRFLFTSLRCDASSGQIQVSIESALGRLLNKLAGSMTESLTRRLKELLTYQMDSEVGMVGQDDGYRTVRTTRFAAVRFANRCLPFADYQARWMDLLAIGAGGIGERHELTEEGTKGLDPYWWSTLNGTQAEVQEFPAFDDLINYFFAGTNGEKMLKDPQGRHRHALTSAVAFCRNILIRDALESTETAVPIEPDWEKRIDAIVATNEKARSAVRGHLKKANHIALTTLIDAALLGISLHLGRCAEFAVGLCSLVPDHVIGSMLDRAPMLKPISVSNNLTTQLQAAKLLGIFASHPKYPPQDREDSIHGALAEIQGWKEAVGEKVNRIRGLTLFVASVLSRQALRGSLDSNDANVSSLLGSIQEILQVSGDKALRNACHISLGQLTLCIGETISDKSHVSAETVIAQLTVDAKKEQESAVIAIGRLIRGLSAGEQGSELTKHALSSLYSLHEIRRPELQFAVGEALSVAAAGWHSKATIAEFDLDVPRSSRGVDQSMLGEILDKTINDSQNTKPSLKKASSIWLLCLIQFTGDQPCVQSRLRQCQAALAKLLSDRDEVVQETGSRGLGLVYEMGDKNLQDDLVRDLVTSFTGGSAKMGGTVTSETELFEPGALPTGDGSVTTYKDIVSLASEMGDPSLVYRFMNLASNNAIWTSRSALGRFGLGNVLADSAYLAENKNFYPKLFRYRFDPNPNVQRSMNDIWNALVKDSNAVIDQNFDLIVEDLLRSMLSGKEWRVRQASCAALADIIQGRDVEQYEKYLHEIWTKAFKVLDDIKESVRAAATKLCKTLTNVLIRNLEVGGKTTNRAQKLLDHAMPFLLQQLQSGATSEVQGYSIATLLKVIRKSPPAALSQYAPVIMETLVASLSSLEHEAVNYFHMNAEKYGTTAEDLDSARVSSVNSSPATQAVERCLEGLDDTSMPEAMKRLESLFKSVIGLPSKVGLSSVLVTLTVRHHLKFRPYADRFAQLLRKHLFDRNATITNSYCLALAYLLRLASEKEMESTAGFTKKLYFESEDAMHRHVAGDIVHAISKVSNDRFMAFASAFLPLAFIGRSDIDAQVKEPFKKTWEDNIGSSRAVPLYLIDIIQLAQHIDSPQWGIKHTVAFAVADLISSLDSAIDGPYSAVQATAIWPLLETALAGKTWEGKEAVVDSFPKFVQKAQTLWQSKGHQMDAIALREAKRANIAYRAHSIAALGALVKTRPSQDLSATVLKAMDGIVDETLSTSEDQMEVDSGGTNSLGSEAQRELRLDKILSAVVGCCFSALTSSSGGGGGDITTDNLELLRRILRQSVPRGSKLTSLAAYEGIRVFLADVMKISRQDETVEGLPAKKEMAAMTNELAQCVKDFATLLLPISPNRDAQLFQAAEQSQTEVVRVARAQAVRVFSYGYDGYASGNFQDALDRSEAQRVVSLWLTNERSGQVRYILRQVQGSLMC